mmetsp:Transcript_3038/g.9037  ORF Transcript_3038/g.9037 Transcript_3038/m.9037 type:complete len:357 (-) Transcript_3038:13-1083(-)
MLHLRIPTRQPETLDGDVVKNERARRDLQRLSTHTPIDNQHSILGEHFRHLECRLAADTIHTQLWPPVRPRPHRVPKLVSRHHHVGAKLDQLLLYGAPLRRRTVANHADTPDPPVFRQLQNVLPRRRVATGVDNRVARLQLDKLLQHPQRRRGVDRQRRRRGQRQITRHAIPVILVDRGKGPPRPLKGLDRHRQVTRLEPRHPRPDGLHDTDPLEPRATGCLLRFGMQRVPALDAANIRRIDRGGEHLEQHTPRPERVRRRPGVRHHSQHVLGHTVRPGILHNRVVDTSRPTTRVQRHVFRNRHGLRTELGESSTSRAKHRMNAGMLYIRLTRLMVAGFANTRGCFLFEKRTSFEN